MSRRWNLPYYGNPTYPVPVCPPTPQKPRSFQRWTEDEEKAIIEMIKDGHDHERIASAVDRTPRAISMRLQEIAVRLYKNGQTDLKILSTMTGIPAEQLEVACPPDITPANISKNGSMTSEQGDTIIAALGRIEQLLMSMAKKSDKLF